MIIKYIFKLEWSWIRSKKYDFLPSIISKWMDTDKKHNKIMNH